MTAPRCIGILQARVSSTRLPGKVLKPLLGTPMLIRQTERLQHSQELDDLIVATSINPADQAIVDLCTRHGITCSRGNLHDVLDRMHSAALAAEADVIVRLTGDCPLTDPTVIDLVIQRFFASPCDYASNTLCPTFPDGLDVEVMTFAALDRAWKEARLPSEREHVTPYIYKHPDVFSLQSITQSPDLSALRWTVDDPADFSLVESIYEALYPTNPYFSMGDILGLLEQRPDIATLGSKATRNEGYTASLRHDNI
ncbi:MAG: glycosyltransferase family protein [Rhodospirillaceae bacterium]|nr:glycosyltransferase family protein [Rhodospirillaceae bacterium]